MGLLFRIDKPTENLKIKNYTYRVDSIVTSSEYNELSDLIDESISTIKEEITKFSTNVFISDFENKSRMNFRVARAFDSEELIAYGIGYCELNELNAFLIDVVYVKENYRRNGIAYELTCRLINSIIDIPTIVDLKLITQDDNINAQKLIQKLQS